MTTFVMIIFLHWGQGAAVATHEFRSFEACDSARHTIDPTNNVTVFCVPKGDTPPMEGGRHMPDATYN